MCWYVASCRSIGATLKVLVIASKGFVGDCLDINCLQMLTSAKFRADVVSLKNVLILLDLTDAKNEETFAPRVIKWIEILDSALVCILTVVLNRCFLDRLLKWFFFRWFVGSR